MLYFLLKYCWLTYVIFLYKRSQCDKDGAFQIDLYIQKLWITCDRICVCICESMYIYSGIGGVGDVTGQNELRIFLEEWTCKDRQNNVEKQYSSRCLHPQNMKVYYETTEAKIM